MPPYLKYLEYLEYCTYGIKFIELYLVVCCATIKLVSIAALTQVHSYQAKMRLIW